MEPSTTAAAGGFAITKILQAVAGLFGALSFSFFYRPKAFDDYGKLTVGAIVGGIGVGASVALGGVIIQYLGMDLKSLDAALGIGYITGGMSVGVIGLIANTFKQRENKDLLQIIQELRAAQQPAKKDESQ